MTPVDVGRLGQRPRDSTNRFTPTKSNHLENLGSLTIFGKVQKIHVICIFNFHSKSRTLLF